MKTRVAVCVLAPMAGLASIALLHTVTAGRPDGVSGVLKRYGPIARREFEPTCKQNGIVWPPKRLTLLAFKAERLLEVWVSNAAGPYARIAVYPILAASGKLGPKQREGDLQVPEGFYRLTHLNPKSQFHLSIRLDYPNTEDIRHATASKDQMGGDIYIHGNRVSLGCIAMGDRVIERLFCLTALADSKERRILIAPVDFRSETAPDPQPTQEWVRALYGRIKNRLKSFPPPDR